MITSSWKEGNSMDRRLEAEKLIAAENKAAAESVAITEEVEPDGMVD